jgi:hypothetical protein
MSIIIAWTQWDWKVHVLAKIAEHLPSKYEALSPIPRDAKKMIDRELGNY